MPASVFIYRNVRTRLFFEFVVEVEELREDGNVGVLLVGFIVVVAD